MNLPAWLIRRQNRRGSDRSFDPGIVAFLWDGGHPRSQPLRDISVDGAFVETAGPWYAGTIVSMTLQAKTVESTSTKPVLVPKLATALPIYRAAAVLDVPAPASIPSVRVACRVVRHDQAGIGVEFIEGDSSHKKMLRKFIAACVAARTGPPGADPVRLACKPQNEIPPLLLQLRNGAMTENSR